MGTAETRTHIQTHDAPGDATKEKRLNAKQTKHQRREQAGPKRRSDGKDHQLVPI